MQNENIDLKTLNADKGSLKGRQPFYYNGEVVYEWEQSLEEVFIYIKAPDCLLEKNREEVRRNLKPGQAMPKLEVVFSTTKLTVGLKGFPPYLEEEYSNKIKASESFWLMDNGEITITLIKAIKAETWLSVFKKHEQVNVVQKEEMQKKMLLERFQEDYGGFDFTDAEITGNVPDPKNFMKDIHHK